ncbi:autotransporter passenger strand-loop-strand repeat-containing protein [Rhizobiales bacterium GAS188]|nr:autotransporter passenger strand-loop-strand repeat-containing protein [Rhizobiales bacterium GAS188]
MATYTITYNVTGNEWVDLNLVNGFVIYDINNVSDFVNETLNYAGPVIGPLITQAYGYNNVFDGSQYLLGNDVFYIANVPSGDIAVGTISGGEFDVTGGETSGVTVEAGGSLVIYTGLDVSALINSGGQERVRSGGIANGAQITNGGYQEVLFGGSATSATISSGGLQQVFGTASDTIVNSGGQQQVGVAGNEITISTIVNSGGSEIVLSGGTASSTTLKGGEQDIYGSAIGTDVNSGGFIAVFSGGTASSTTVNSGGLYNFSGYAHKTTVNSGGFEIDYSGAIADSTIVNSGGIEYVLSGATATSTTVNSGGLLGLQGGALASGWTISSGGILGIKDGYNLSNYQVSDTVLEVRSGGIASGTTIDSGGVEYVQNSGTDISAIVNSGGSQYLQASPTIFFSGGSEIFVPGTGAETVSGTIINSGGNEYVSSGGIAIGTSINSGGTATVYDGGTLSGTVVDNGTLIFNLSGTDTFAGTLTGSGSLVVEGGGKLVLSGGDAFTGQVTISGGTLELTSAGAAGSGSIAFGSAPLTTLKIDGTTMPKNVISGFTPADSIDLANVPFDSTSGATIFATANAPPANYVLQVVEGGPLIQGGNTHDLQLDSSKPFGGGFQLSADPSGKGTDITVSSGAVTNYSTSTNNSPYSGVCQISYVNANGVEVDLGTGFIIGSQTILTAAHVVKPAGQVLKDMIVRPGTPLAGTGPAFFGDAVANPMWNPRSSTGETPSEAQYDFAIINCPGANFSPSSWFGLLPNYPGGTVNLTGYPGVFLEQTTQFNDIGTVTADPNYALLDYGPTTPVISFPGDSGGPLWVYNGSTVSAVGIAVTDVWAVQLTSSNLDLIQKLGISFTDVGPGQTLNGIVIANGNTLEVLGTAIGTVVNSGGTENVYGTDTGATVNNGGFQYVLAGGTATNTRVDGIQVVSAGGTAISATLGGGEQDVYGTAGNTIVDSGGLEDIFSGGIASATTINGGTMELTSGGSAGSGPITFKGTGGMLKVDGTAMPNNVISGFALGDTIDLTGVSFSSGGSVALISGNVLQIVENGQTYDLQLNPQQSFRGESFDLSADKSGGTNVVLDAPERPTLTVPSSLTVAAGGSIAMGISVTPVDSDDAVFVGITGVPRFETITAGDGHLVRKLPGGTYIFTAADVNTAGGLTLHSSYGGTGHPVNKLIVAAANTTAGELAATIPPKTITVTDPPATISPSYQSLALLNQFSAAGLREQDGIPIVASSRTEINPGAEAFLTQPHHEMPV